MGQEMVRAVAAAIAALTLVLIFMKLDGLIDWSWRWVTAPLWGSGLILIVGWIAFVATVGAAMHRRDAEIEAASRNATETDENRPS